MKIFNIFLIFAQNIDCEYTLEPPHCTHNLSFGAIIRKKVYPCKPQFYYIKVGCKGVFVTQTCFRDELSCKEIEIFHSYCLFKVRANRLANMELVVFKDEDVSIPLNFNCKYYKCTVIFC